MQRKKLIQHVGEQILSINQNHPLRVGIDGIDASGKTSFADELAAYLSQSNREIVQASIDNFHNPQEQRYQKGRKSPEGYYHDSFNNKAIRDHLLEPLGDNGNLQYVTDFFDYRKDSFVAAHPKTAAADAILIMEGIFLFRPELVAYWDFKIFLQISFEKSLERAMFRDADYLGTKDDIEDMYNDRYIPGQKLYFLEAEPEKQADVIIDNNDFSSPFIV